MNKSDRNAFVSQMLIYTLVMVLFSGSIGLSTVWLRQQIAFTANSIKQLETRTRDLERHLSETNALVAAEQSPDVLLRRNNEWSLGLVLPHQSQVQRVAERPEELLAAKRNRDVFSAAQPDVVKVKFVMEDSRR